MPEMCKLSIENMAPGLRGTPAGMTTTWAPSRAAGSSSSPTWPVTLSFSNATKNRNLGGGVDMAKIASDTWKWEWKLQVTLGVGNVEDSELGDKGVLLQKQGQGLANATSATQNGDLVHSLKMWENWDLNGRFLTAAEEEKERIPRNDILQQVCLKNS
jgi:hypothetical protein